MQLLRQFLGKKFCLGAAQGDTKVKKCVFDKNTKWPPAVLFVNDFFWSKNKSGQFWEDSALKDPVLRNYWQRKYFMEHVFSWRGTQENIFFSLGQY